MILTAEHILWIFGKHKRFICGRKTVTPNIKVRTNEELDEIEKDFEEGVDKLGKALEEVEEGQEKTERQEGTENEGQNMEKGEPKCSQCLAQYFGCLTVCFMRCMVGLTACFLRFSAWSYFAYNEVMYQLWGGERYDRLEVLEALNPALVRQLHYKQLKAVNPLLLNSNSILGIAHKGRGRERAETLNEFYSDSIISRHACTIEFPVICLPTWYGYVSKCEILIGSSISIAQGQSGHTKQTLSYSVLISNEVTLAFH